MHTPVIRSTVALLTAVCVLTACGGKSASPTSTPLQPTPTALASPTATGASIRIDTPIENATVDLPIHAGGAADVFEAALAVDMQDASGRSLCVRHIMATSGTGTPGTWATTLAFPPPSAPEPLTLRAYSLSAKDGSIVNLVTRSVTVSARHPAIFITSPACGATVAPGTMLAVQGRAFVFEAALTVELRDASGTAVVTQNVMAASGTEESDFRAALAIPATLPSGFYDLVAFDRSAKDGSIENEFSIQVEVSR